MPPIFRKFAWHRRFEPVHHVLRDHAKEYIVEHVVWNNIVRTRNGCELSATSATAENGEQR